MTSHRQTPSEHSNAPGGREPGERAVGGHSHLHGKPSSWALVGVVIAAFVAGAFAVVYGLWWLFWICAGVVVLSVPIGKIIDIMGDTVLAGDPSQQAGQDKPAAEDAGSAADPGVDVGPQPALAPSPPPAASS
jgi:hypothetical protein